MALLPSGLGATGCPGSTKRPLDAPLDSNVWVSPRTLAPAASQALWSELLRRASDLRSHSTPVRLQRLRGCHRSCRTSPYWPIEGSTPVVRPRLRRGRPRTGAEAIDAEQDVRPEQEEANGLQC